MLAHANLLLAQENEIQRMLIGCTRFMYDSSTVAMGYGCNKASRPENLLQTGGL